MTNQRVIQGQEVADALSVCPPLSHDGQRRDELWLAVQAAVCTRTEAPVVPLGSVLAVQVTAEYATDELICAMEWLMTHEAKARELSPLRLYVMLRGAATRGAHGSARRAQADALHGLTNVVPGQPVRWSHSDPWTEAS